MSLVVRRTVRDNFMENRNKYNKLTRRRLNIIYTERVTNRFVINLILGIVYHLWDSAITAVKEIINIIVYDVYAFV